MTPPAPAGNVHEGYKIYFGVGLNDQSTSLMMGNDHGRGQSNGYDIVYNKIGVKELTPEIQIVCPL